LLAIALVLLGVVYARAQTAGNGSVWVITEGEAMLPSPPTARGGAALPQGGPLIRIERPDLATPQSPPFVIDVVFEPRPGRATVKMDSLKVVYLKIIELDVTERFKPHVKENRLFVEKANVPSGRHRLKITISDADGNMTGEILQVTVK
jgi:hypothetical protein